MNIEIVVDLFPALAIFHIKVFNLSPEENIWEDRQLNCIFYLVKKWFHKDRTREQHQNRGSDLIAHC